MKIGLVVFDGFTDLDFYLPWDLLNRVHLLSLAEEWTVQILADSLSLTSATGLKLCPTQPYEYANECNGIFFCSGPKTRDLIKDVKFLSKFHLDPSRQVIAAIDSGSLILGALNLLNGKQATTYPTVFPELEKLGAIPVQESFVEVGRIATASRCLNGAKLALWMVEKLSSKEISDKVFETVRPLAHL
jgi:transcriptional regulator GlxA family with amidase domain